jgi:hypothetical protein
MENWVEQTAAAGAKLRQTACNQWDVSYPIHERDSVNDPFDTERLNFLF